MKKCRLSIIIPVHNASNYLDDCIISVINQANSETEIILVENGSSDNSEEICHQYAEQYEIISFYKIEKTGVSYARNFGTVKAVGEYVLFLDADDMLQPNVIQTISKELPSDVDIMLMSYSRKHPVEQTGLSIMDVDKMILLKAVLHFAKYRQELVTCNLDEFSIWTCWGKCFKRGFLLANDIMFPEGVTHGEDAAFFFKAVCKAERIYSMNLIMYYYRFNSLSVTYTGKGRYVNEDILLIHLFEDFSKSLSFRNQIQKELYNFYTIKIIESYLLFGKNTLQIILGDSVITNAVISTRFNNLIVGKKNQIKYCTVLLSLKIHIIVQQWLTNI